MKILDSIVSLVVNGSIRRERAAAEEAKFLQAAPPAVTSEDGRPITEEVASTVDGRDITIGYVSAKDLLNPPKGFLQADLMSHDRFDDILADPQVESVYKQLRLTMLEKEWGVTPGAKDALSKKAADSLFDQVNANKWDLVSSLMHYGFHYGYSVAEMMWETSAREVFIDAIKVRNRRRFMFSADQSPRLLTFQNPAGEELPAQKFWYFSANAVHGDEPYGLGYAHWLYWLTFFKRNLTRYWLTDLEKYGSPTSIGKFPATYNIQKNKQERDNHARLVAALQTIQHDSGVAIPDDMAIELLQAARSSNGTHYEMMQYFDRQISKVITGQSFTADDQAGGQNKGDTYKAILDAGSKANSNIMDESFNDGPAKWLTDWNYPGAAYPRLYRNYDPPEDLQRAVDVDTKLYAMGWQPSPQRVSEIYGSQYERRTDTNNPQPPIDNNPQAVGFAEAEGVLNRENMALDEALNQIAVERFGDEAQTILQPVLDKILAEGPNAARDDVAQLYPEMDSAALENLLARFFFIANTWGRLNER